MKLMLLLLSELDAAGNTAGMVAAVAHHFGIPPPLVVRDLRSRDETWSLLAIGYGSKCYYYYANGAAAAIDFPSPLDHVGTIF